MPIFSFPVVIPPCRWGLRGFLCQQLQWILDDNSPQSCTPGARPRSSALEEEAFPFDRRGKAEVCSSSACGFDAPVRCKREEREQPGRWIEESGDHVAEVHERNENDTDKDAAATMRSRSGGRDSLKAKASTGEERPQSSPFQTGQGGLLSPSRGGESEASNEAVCSHGVSQRLAGEGVQEPAEPCVSWSSVDRDAAICTEPAEFEATFLVEGGDVTGARKVSCLSERGKTSLQVVWGSSTCSGTRSPSGSTECGTVVAYVRLGARAAWLNGKTSAFSMPPSLSVAASTREMKASGTQFGQAGMST